MKSQEGTRQRGRCAPPISRRFRATVRVEPGALGFGGDARAGAALQTPPPAPLCGEGSPAVIPPPSITDPTQSDLVGTSGPLGDKPPRSPQRPGTKGQGVPGSPSAPGVSALGVVVGQKPLHQEQTLLADAHLHTLAGVCGMRRRPGRHGLLHTDRTEGRRPPWPQEARAPCRESGNSFVLH